MLTYLQFVTVSFIGYVFYNSSHAICLFQGGLFDDIEKKSKTKKASIVEEEEEEEKEEVVKGR